jgi:hypothetical protein
MIAMSEEFQRIKDAYTLYEAGKKRRYDLLFAVNGGAFAIAQLLNKPDSKLPGSLSLTDLAIGMAIFTILMTYDIYAFGEKMRDRHLPGEVFGPVGKAVLRLIGLLIVSGWLLVALGSKFPKEIFVTLFLIAAIALFYLDRWYPPWKRKGR